MSPLYLGGMEATIPVMISTLTELMNDGGMLGA